ncbi:hypothetical protein HDV03_002271 [Kappamyces sp. JEL0829]|nr:hypothetical protein HDV03_002271 [Kappamyces sp. JEL0829]
MADTKCPIYLDDSIDTATMNSSEYRGFLNKYCTSDCAAVNEAAAVLYDTGACAKLPPNGLGRTPQDRATLWRIYYAEACSKSSDGAFCEVQDLQLIESLGLQNASWSEIEKNTTIMCTNCGKVELEARVHVQHPSAAVAANNTKIVNSFNALCPSFAVTPSSSGRLTVAIGSIGLALFSALW